MSPDTLATAVAEAEAAWRASPLVEGAHIDPQAHCFLSARAGGGYRSSLRCGPVLREGQEGTWDTMSLEVSAPRPRVQVQVRVGTVVEVSGDLDPGEVLQRPGDEGGSSATARGSEGL